MRKALSVALLVVLARGVPGCASCDIDEAITIEAEASTDANTYSEGSVLSAHALEVFVFLVDEPEVFLAADAGRLQVMEKGSQVPGGQAIDFFTVMPGEKLTRHFGKDRKEAWTHVGVYAAYMTPVNAAEAIKRIIEIPDDCGASLKLEAGAIGAFAD